MKITNTHPAPISLPAILDKDGKQQLASLTIMPRQSVEVPAEHVQAMKKHTVVQAFAKAGMIDGDGLDLTAEDDKAHEPVVAAQIPQVPAGQSSTAIPALDDDVKGRGRKA